jgi:anaerobic selenocysteine-containing dehydrogenase
MATAVAAYKQSFGFDAPPFTYADFEESDVIVLVGSNLCIAHPIMWQRVLRNKHQPEIIVIDPRKTETAVAATQHYALKPKSDLILLYGIAYLLIERGWINSAYIAAHTTGYDGFAGFVKQFPPERVAEVTGISVSELNRLAETIHQGKRVSFWWTMGVNQGHEATRTAQAIINLALMTGNIGRPGTGANLLGGHDFLNAEHRRKVADILHLDEARVPAKNSLAYDQIVQGIADGKIKGLWVIATNSSHSWIHQNEFARILKKLDFLVVQDMYHTTETAREAHLVLPAAAWGEKDGTFINSERRIGLVKKISKAPGHALSDFNICKLIAHYWGCSAMFKDWTSPEAVFQIMKKLSKDQPCDITGIRDYRMLDECGGIQWPLPEGTKSEVRGLRGADGTSSLIPHTSNLQERRLFEDGRYFHSDGRAKFLFEAPREAPESTDSEFPLLLLTGRGTSAQWHTQTRTGKSGVLRQLYPENIYVEINPRDATRLGIRSQQMVEVRSRRGRVLASAFVTGTVQPGQIFIPMHYAETNRLTFPSFDPYSRQPSYKSCAVAVLAAPKGHAAAHVPAT